MIHQPALTIESIHPRFVNCSPRPRESDLRDSHDTNSRPPAENHENHETLHFCSQRRYESKASVQDQNGDNTFETYHYTGTYLKPNHKRCIFSQGCPTLRTALSIKSCNPGPHRNVSHAGRPLLVRPHSRCVRRCESLRLGTPTMAGFFGKR